MACSACSGRCGTNGRWHLSLAAMDALQTLTRTPFDVVVSDMRMPGMDGAKLLKEVQGRFPHIVRIVLSGQSDQNMIDQARGAAHQYLAKPCQPDKLKATISRACDLRTG